MEIKIHQCENVSDLREIILAHYDLCLEDLEQLKKSELSDPWTCTHMESCISILKDIKEKKEKILICGQCGKSDLPQEPFSGKSGSACAWKAGYRRCSDWGRLQEY